MPRLPVALGLLALAACTAPQPCPSPLHECDGQCVDIESNHGHCGACGNACATGQVCVGTVCTVGAPGPCPSRTGGAFVTIGQCGSTVKVWVQADALVDAAIARVGAAPDPSFVPSFGVLPRSDCDLQWSWHVDPASASTSDEASIDPASACTRCPAEIQPAASGSTPTTRRWCPAGATVLGVDDRRALP